MSGGGGPQTTTTGVPDELKPLAREYTSRAIGMADTPFTPYTGQRFQDFTPAQQQAMGMIQQRATEGSPIIDQAGSTVTDLLQGGTNPYLDQMVGRAQQNLVDQYQDVIRPQQDALMARSGSFGNAGVMETMGNQQDQLLQGLGDISTQMYGNAYNTNRQNQLAALGLAPQIAGQDYLDASQLLQSGNMQQQFGQQQQDFNYQQFQDMLNQPYKNLQTLGAPFSMGLGSVTKTTGGGK